MSIMSRARQTLEDCGKVRNEYWNSFTSCNTLSQVLLLNFAFTPFDKVCHPLFDLFWNEEFPKNFRRNSKGDNKTSTHSEPIHPILHPGSWGNEMRAEPYVSKCGNSVVFKWGSAAAGKKETKRWWHEITRWARLIHSNVLLVSFTNQLWMTRKVMGTGGEMEGVTGRKWGEKRVYIH